jgi:hypothetical protein
MELRMELTIQEFDSFVACKARKCSVDDEKTWQLCDRCWEFRNKCKKADAIWKSAVYFRLKAQALDATVDEE